MLNKPFSQVPFTLRMQDTLKSSEVDIWFFNLNDPIPKHHPKLLSPDEAARAERFHFDKHRHHFTRARAMLRCVLAHYLNAEPASLAFEYGKHGKPSLQHHPQLQFNLSHSGKLALLAVGHTHPVGIDIEAFSERPYAGIGRQVFSEHENTKLDALANPLKPMMFFNVWSQKEAFIKYWGLGLAYPTTKLTVDAMAREAYEIHCPIHDELCGMLPFMLEIGYASSLCHHPAVQHVFLSDAAHYFDSP